MSIPEENKQAAVARIESWIHHGAKPESGLDILSTVVQAQLLPHVLERIFSVEANILGIRQRAWVPFVRCYNRDAAQSRLLLVVYPAMSFEDRPAHLQGVSPSAAILSDSDEPFPYGIIPLDVLDEDNPFRKNAPEGATWAVFLGIAIYITGLEDIKNLEPEPMVRLLALKFDAVEEQTRAWIETTFPKAACAAS